MLYLPEAAIDVIKIFTLGVLSFLVAFLLTPLLTKILYKYQLWRKEVRTQAIDGKDLTYFQKFHSQGETHVPRFGGLLIWIVPSFLAIFFYTIHKMGINIWWLQKLNFLNRGQTWLPFFALVSASLVGFLDDFLQVIGKGKYIAKGLTLKQRIILMGAIGAVGAWWFYSKLEWSSLHVPGIGDFEIGIWYLPLFIIVMMATYSGGVIDGLDGLAGGAFASIFGAFAGIALFLGQINVAAFCAVILGALLAFLWFNIPPARFYMGETGMMGLCAALTVVAFLTDSVLVLPIIGFLLVLESGSVILQLLSKKFRHKKILLAAPIHHHFEAKGWPAHQVTMRFWIIGVVCAIIGMA
ncbi:MAG: phospho-N-acetylmuramoyl-pentapeptide-transferase, partial [Candidatus Nealsonbacteria bacterium]